MEYLSIELVRVDELSEPKIFSSPAFPPPDGIVDTIGIIHTISKGDFNVFELLYPIFICFVNSNICAS